MNKNAIEKFKVYFTQMKLDDDTTLNEIYAGNVVFSDPIHTITGIENLRAYFKKLNSNLLTGSFQFKSESTVGTTTYIEWEMNLQLKRPQKKIRASGISVLKIDEKIIQQRDYFDAGELFYENIPALGGIVRFIKRKLAEA